MSAVDTLELVVWARQRDLDQLAEMSPGATSFQFANKRFAKWTVPLVPASALEASEAKIAALTAENDGLREERNLADNALVDRYRDPKTGVFSFPTDVEAIVRRLDVAEVNRDALRAAIEAVEQHERSSFIGDPLDKARRASWRGVMRKVRAALRQEGKP